jgi:competence protein ComGC
MKKRSFTVTELLVVVILIAFLFIFVMPVLLDHQEPSRRATCGSNLKMIGIAMDAYANENSESFPAVPHDPASILVGTDMNQSATDGQSPWRNLSPNAQDDAFAKNEKGDFAAPVKTPTVSASLWLLCRLNMATPKVFVCLSVKNKAMADDPLMEINKLASPKYFSDFYTDPSAGALISYSFVSPYSSNWNTNANSGYSIGADENDGNNPAMAQDQIEKNGTQANSTTHNGEGQNVLRIDASVSFEKSPYAGINNDNIYTALPDNYAGLPKDTPGILSVRPRTKEDSVLIPVKESRLTGWDRKP